MQNEAGEARDRVQGLAMETLVKLGYEFLDGSAVLSARRGDLQSVLLESVLEGQLERLNGVSLSSAKQSRSHPNIGAALARLSAPSLQRGLVRSSEGIYDLLTLGEGFQSGVGSERRRRQVRFVDWDRPEENQFHVAAGFEIVGCTGSVPYRPDIVCFVNGIPFLVIECQADLAGGEFDEAIQRQVMRQAASAIPHLYTCAQLLIVLGSAGGRYGTTGTDPCFWAQWRELGPGADEAIERRLGPALDGERREWLQRSLPGLMAEPAVRAISDADRLLWSLARPERLLELVRQFVLYDGGGTQKKVARYQQYFTVKRTMERVRERDAAGRRRGGVIWHTQGSGKSLTMVLLGKALALDPSIIRPRLLLVTDRVDLDAQIWKTFQQCGLVPVQAKTGRHLLELLRSDRWEVITTVVDKFRAAAKIATGVISEAENLFILVDESHRSQYGEANARMTRALPNACVIGFTGTPLMKKEKHTARKFGGFIEPAYTIRDAVRDGAVVPLWYEGRHVLQQLDRDALDRAFDRLAMGLSLDARARLKTRVASRNRLHQLESRLELVAWDFSRTFVEQWQGTGFKAQITAGSKAEALILKRCLDRIGRVTSELVISPPHEMEGTDGAEPDRPVHAFWREMMERFGSEKEYLRSITEAFRQADAPEVLIVVDKLLTGFDVPRNRVFVIVRPLQGHALLQAIARVNRLHPGKDSGWVLDYCGVGVALGEALTLYSGSTAEFESDDLDGLLTDVRDEWARLPGLREAVWSALGGRQAGADRDTYRARLTDPSCRRRFELAWEPFRRALSHLPVRAQGIEEERALLQCCETDARLFRDLWAEARGVPSGRERSSLDRRIEQALEDCLVRGELVEVVKPVPIRERVAVEAEMAKAHTQRAKAHVAALLLRQSATSAVTREVALDPALSDRVASAIEDYWQDRLTEREYWQRMEGLLADECGVSADSLPEGVRSRPLAAKVFGCLTERWPAPSDESANPESETADVLRETPVPYRTQCHPLADPEEVFAKMACQIEAVIRAEQVVGWENNPDALNRMRNGVDDVLIAWQRREGRAIQLRWMDSIVEAAVSAALAEHR